MNKSNNNFKNRKIYNVYIYNKFDFLINTLEV